MQRVYFYILAVIFLFCTPAYADYQEQVKQIIEKTTPPEGVVFEVVSKDKRFLNQAIPEIERLSRQLKSHFPDLEIVVVSHGSEMFALTRSNQKNNPELVEQLESLSGEGVNVHVCGTLAEMRNVDHSEFPSNIEVAVSGPTEIAKYIDLGFVHIKVSAIKK
ncbi:MAG: DsrE family protein [Gammaproteobacteria bacterium]|nr:DsrE family protein [Gammaproteobacteria bacterium]MDH5594744.1 DsrE family protein [Gammaproteobacteria bacterium]